SAVYDPVRDRMLVFGGRALGIPQDDVWELSFSGALAWRLIVPSGTPPAPRLDQVAIYDPVRVRMIVFGGTDASGAQLNDVWALSLSGTPTWTKLAPSGSAPGVRGAPAAIYDPVRDRMIVFGGYSGNPAAALSEPWALSLAWPPPWAPL